MTGENEAPLAPIIQDVSSEAGVIASIILKPELVFTAEQLHPNHFSDSQNAYVYYAVSELAKKDVNQIDAFSIVNKLGSDPETENALTIVTIEAVKDLVNNASIIARNTPEAYGVLADNVLNAAFRRDTLKKLRECEWLCYKADEDEIEQKIYRALDDVMSEFSTSKEVPQYKDVVDRLWGEIVARQGRDGVSGIPFKFPSLNSYVTIEPGELVVFGATMKAGKSIMLLNCAVDLLKRGQAVLYIDSELNSRMFTCRLVAHIARIEFGRVKSGNYTEEEAQRINGAIAWLKTCRFTHIYMPIFDSQSIYTTVKRVKHQQGLDVLIVDYFKSTGDGDAYATYAEMGKLVDMVKNKIAGDQNIAAIGAAQATADGRLADSAKISRNASTIIMLQDKTQDEVDADGAECGNKKLRVKFNRNGAQQSQDEYIDLQFNGNLISFEEAKQHAPVDPF